MANHLKPGVRIGWAAAMLVDVLAESGLSGIRARIEARTTPAAGGASGLVVPARDEVTLTMTLYADGTTLEETHELVDYLRAALDTPFIVTLEGARVKIAYHRGHPPPGAEWAE